LFIVVFMFIEYDTTSMIQW